MGLGVDHFTLNKFASPEDGNFICVCAQAEELCKLAIKSEGCDEPDCGMLNNPKVSCHFLVFKAT